MAPCQRVDVQERVTAVERPGVTTDGGGKRESAVQHTHDRLVSMSLELGMSPGRT